MLSNKRLIAFCIYSLCLLGIPAKMILDQTKTFNEGTAYKFKCQPVDPNDPFRGKYVRLGFESIEFPSREESDSRTSFGVIKTDLEGYSSISSVVYEYSDNQPMIELNTQYVNDSTISYLLPFDRLYMNENKAQAAEDLYRNALRDTMQDVYAKVYIARGRYLLDDVYVNGIRLKNTVD